MGAWSYVQPRLLTMLRELCPERNGDLQKVVYVGRVTSSSPATGNPAVHQSETKEIIDAALEWTSQGKRIGEWFQ